MTDSKSAPNQVFDSAIDLWIAAVLFLSPALAAGIGVHLMIDQKPTEASILFLVAALTLVLTLALTLPCRYTLLSDALAIRCGLIVYQIPLQEIEAVEKSASLRSGPALSLKRVVVVTAKRRHVLSPKHRDEFIDAMNEAIAQRRAA